MAKIRLGCDEKEAILIGMGGRKDGWVLDGGGEGEAAARKSRVCT